MSNAFIKLIVSQLDGFLFLVALTGFVCTHKIQAEEECLSSNVMCYECDSRNDPNCADPFDFSTSTTLSLPPLKGQQPKGNLTGFPELRTNETNSSISQREPKRLPAVTNCHGCCVKITSKLPDGSTYVKRTCTTNIQINYFMVGLVCMKESGDRGRMCFCETDYCNGQISNLKIEPLILTLFVMFSSLRLYQHASI